MIIRWPCARGLGPWSPKRSVWIPNLRRDRRAAGARHIGAGVPRLAAPEPEAAEPEQSFDGRLPSAGQWFTDALAGVLVHIGGEFVEALRQDVDWALGVDGRGPNFVSRALPEYESPSVRLTEATRAAAPPWRLSFLRKKPRLCRQREQLFPSVDRGHFDLTSEEVVVRNQAAHGAVPFLSARAAIKLHSVDRSPLVDPTQSRQRHYRYSDLETGLRGLIYFYRALGNRLRIGDLAGVWASRWYYSALVLHADMLFTSDRGKDTQPGAALRALRDLGRLDLVAKLEAALELTATANGRTLGQTIKRIRNEVLVHHSFDLEEQGSALLFLGEPDARAADAFFGLIQTVEEVLVEIEGEKRRLTTDIFFAGTVTIAVDEIRALPAKAREKERQRRLKQREDAKGRTRRQKDSLGGS